MVTDTQIVNLASRLQNIALNETADREVVETYLKHISLNLQRIEEIVKKNNEGGSEENTTEQDKQARKPKRTTLSSIRIQDSINMKAALQVFRDIEKKNNGSASLRKYKSDSNLHVIKKMKTQRYEDDASEVDEANLIGLDKEMVEENGATDSCEKINQRNYSSENISDPIQSYEPATSYKEAEQALLNEIVAQLVHCANVENSSAIFSIIGQALTV